MMKKVEIIENGNIVNKLTVTPTRITVKIQDGITEQEKIRVIDFFMRVANFFDDPMYNFSMRGGEKLPTNVLRISMANNSGRINYHFREDEPFVGHVIYTIEKE